MPQTFYAPNQFYSQVRPTLPGRMVSSPNEITPNEVPMDGTIGVFVRNDLTEVYVKSWSPNGTISTNVFHLTKEEAKAENTNEETLKTILERLDAVEDKVSRFTKPNKKGDGNQWQTQQS